MPGDDSRFSRVISELYIKLQIIYTLQQRRAHVVYKAKKGILTSTMPAKNKRKRPQVANPLVSKPFLVEKTGRDAFEVLTLHPEYKRRSSGVDTAKASAGQPDLRVSASSFKYRGYGPYTIDANRESLFKRILATPPDKRHFCVTIMNGDRVYSYLDLDAGAAWLDENGKFPEPAPMIEAVKHIFCDAFESCFKRQFPWDATMWIFQCTQPTKLSLHVHADPWKSGDYIWATTADLGYFVKHHVQPRALRAFKDRGDPLHAYGRMLYRAPPCSTGAIGVEAGENNHTSFIDHAVYNKSQQVKLPLCCKPDKPAMMLFAPAKNWGIRENTNSESESDSLAFSAEPTPEDLLEVGMAVAQKYNSNLLLRCAEAGQQKRRFVARNWAKRLTPRDRGCRALTVPEQSALAVVGGYGDVECSYNRTTKTYYYKAARGEPCARTRQPHSSPGNVNFGTLVWKDCMPYPILTTKCFSPGCWGKNACVRLYINRPSRHDPIWALFPSRLL